MIRRTNGATKDPIYSSCSLAGGNDVWYSVVGTGDTIMATTCSYALSHSYETYVSTIVDVFSSQDTWEHLECIATTKTVKSKDAATTKVIPEQFIGHTTVC
jgi:hypothetical protein